MTVVNFWEGFPCPELKLTNSATMLPASAAIASTLSNVLLPVDPFAREAVRLHEVFGNGCMGALKLDEGAPR